MSAGRGILMPLTKSIQHRMRRSALRAGSIASALALSTVAVPAAAAPALIDNFDSDAALQGWKFSNGPEFPGAAGDATTTAGLAGKAVSLSYDFSDGGRYVAIQRKLPTPLTVKAIRLDLRAPAETTVNVQVLDSTGQWLVYTV